VQVCPDWGYESGNDDNPGTAPPISFEAYRAEWIAEGERLRNALLASALSGVITSPTRGMIVRRQMSNLAASPEPT